MEPVQGHCQSPPSYMCSGRVVAYIRSPLTTDTRDSPLLTNQKKKKICTLERFENLSPNRALLWTWPNSQHTHSDFQICSMSQSLLHVALWKLLHSPKPNSCRGSTVEKWSRGRTHLDSRGIEASQLCTLSSLILSKVLSPSVASLARLEMGVTFLSSSLTCLRKERKHTEHTTWYIQSRLQNPIRN